MLADSLLDFGIAGQGAAGVHTEAFGGLDFRNSVVADALVDNNTGGFLSEHTPLAIVTV
jgi:hypothetical protein